MPAVQLKRVRSVKLREKLLNKTAKSAITKETQTLHTLTQKEPLLDYGLQRKWKRHWRKVTRLSKFTTFGTSTRAVLSYGRSNLHEENSLKLNWRQVSLHVVKKSRQKARKFDIELGVLIIAKICLNSLWGKFGQNPKAKHSEYIDNETKDEFLKVNYNTNIYIACFTSSWARVKLYNMLEKLDRNVCYCDTDSIIYIENEQTKSVVDMWRRFGRVDR